MSEKDAGVAQTTAQLRAAGDPVRWSILQILTADAPLTATQLAVRLGRSADLITKHLLVLRKAGLLKIVTPEGEDRRKQFHVLATERTVEGSGRVVLDYGGVVLKFG